MKISIILGVKVTRPNSMPEAEASEYVEDQLKVRKGKLVAMDIKLADDGFVELHPHYDSVIRIRRITGYLSEVKNFNPAKQDEAAARVVHE